MILQHREKSTVELVEFAAATAGWLIPSQLWPQAACWASRCLQEKTTTFAVGTSALR